MRDDIHTLYSNHHLSPEAEESLTKNGGGKTTLTVDDDEISINSTDLRVDVGFLPVSSSCNRCSLLLILVSDPKLNLCRFIDYQFSLICNLTDLNLS